MDKALDWLGKNEARLIDDLGSLVAIPSISTDGAHDAEIERAAELTRELMNNAGLEGVELLRSGGSHSYAYGEWLGAPGKPTLFLYAHHDVQPVNFPEQWKSDPWMLTEREGRFYGRGSADDKGAIVVQLGAIAAWLETAGRLPVNVKMLVEGEEEIGSLHLHDCFREHREKLMSDVIVVCDTDNIETGLPCITASLRGLVALRVTVESAAEPRHSGMTGGALPDPALALNVILARLHAAPDRELPGLHDGVRPLTPAERATLASLPFDAATWRREMGVLEGVELPLPPGVSVFEATWRRPAITIIAQEASSIRNASNQVLPRAVAIVSVRTVPDQDPREVYDRLRELLLADPPWNVRVSIEPAHVPVDWWMTDPKGPAFAAALTALERGFEAKPVAIGCGGTIGFVGPLAELFGGAPALLLGIEDPRTNAHAPNESLDAGDFRKLTRSLVYLFDELASLPSSER